MAAMADARGQVRYVQDRRVRARVLAAARCLRDGSQTLVICRTRELAYQIKHEFDRFAMYSTKVKTGVVFGGMPIAKGPRCCL